MGFTGQDHDNDLGLIDMKGRVYDPLAGRFMTADPVTQAPFWSQGLNRYSYVFNNPINSTDPSGFMANGGESTTTIMGWGGAVTALGVAGGFGLGTAALNPVTSAFLPGIGAGSAGSTQSVAAPSGAPSGTGNGGRNPPGGAHANNFGGIVELAKPIPSPDMSVPEYLRSSGQRLAQNFQYGGYCHEDGPCHDSLYLPDISGGDFARADAAISNWFQRLWRWVGTKGLGFGTQDLVLGLNKSGRLKQWTTANGGRTFGEFNTPRGSFDVKIRSAMDQAENIRFNLDGVDVSRANGALNEFGEPINGYTNYELHLIKTIPEYLEKTTFYRNGVLVPATL